MTNSNVLDTSRFAFTVLLVAVALIGSFLVSASPASAAVYRTWNMGIKVVNHNRLPAVVTLSLTDGTNLGTFHIQGNSSSQVIAYGNHQTDAGNVQLEVSVEVGDNLGTQGTQLATVNSDATYQHVSVDVEANSWCTHAVNRTTCNK